MFENIIFWINNHQANRNYSLRIYLAKDIFLRLSVCCEEGHNDAAKIFDCNSFVKF